MQVVFGNLQVAPKDRNMGQQSEPSYYSNMKHCVQCAYWAGSRTTNPNNSFVFFDGLSTGQCMATPAKQMKTPQQTCNKFEKWPVLK